MLNESINKYNQAMMKSLFANEFNNHNDLYLENEFTDAMAEFDALPFVDNGIFNLDNENEKYEW